MISRRLLRIKALQILFAFFRGDNDSLEKTEKELLHSIKKGYDLYHYIFLLLLEIQQLALRRIESAKQKLVPTYDDLHPNMRFVNNPIFDIIMQNESINYYLTYNKLSWSNYPELIKKFHQKVTLSSQYRNYMNLRDVTFDNHKQIILHIINKELLKFEDFYQCLEEQSIYWNDDVELMISMAARTIRKFESGQPISAPVLPMYKDEEDEDFAKKLIRKVVLNHEENIKIIDKYTQNWEVDRIASMDVLIMEMAITEILHFPTVPVKVTFNEYIELSKLYSTEQSGTFINGVLDKIITTFKNEDKIHKQGKGLLGDEE